jgi:hypothetical protein
MNLIDDNDEGFALDFERATVCFSCMRENHMIDPPFQQRRSTRVGFEQIILLPQIIPRSYFRFGSICV